MTARGRSRWLRSEFSECSWVNESGSDARAQSWRFRGHWSGRDRWIRGQVWSPRRRLQNVLRSDGAVQRRQRFAQGLGCLAQWCENWPGGGWTAAVAGRGRGGGSAPHLRLRQDCEGQSVYGGKFGIAGRSIRQCDRAAWSSNGEFGEKFC